MLAVYPTVRTATGVRLGRVAVQRLRRYGVRVADRFTMGGALFSLCSDGRYRSGSARADEALRKVVSKERRLRTSEAARCGMDGCGGGYKLSTGTGPYRCGQGVCYQCAARRRRAVVGRSAYTLESAGIQGRYMMVTVTPPERVRSRDELSWFLRRAREFLAAFSREYDAGGYVAVVEGPARWDESTDEVFEGLPLPAMHFHVHALVWFPTVEHVPFAAAHRLAKQCLVGHGRGLDLRWCKEVGNIAAYFAKYCSKGDEGRGASWGPEWAVTAEQRSAWAFGAWFARRRSSWTTGLFYGAKARYRRMSLRERFGWSAVERPAVELGCEDSAGLVELVIGRRWLKCVSQYSLGLLTQVVKAAAERQYERRAEGTDPARTVDWREVAPATSEAEPIAWACDVAVAAPSRRGVVQYGPRDYGWSPPVFEDILGNVRWLVDGLGVGG